MPTGLAAQLDGDDASERHGGGEEAIAATDAKR